MAAFGTTRRASRFSAVSGGAVALLGAMLLGGCNQGGGSSVAGTQTRGATVAFESIDGPPNRQFQRLVNDLNDEAQTRRLAVLSRDQKSAYRVRGYLAAQVAQGQTIITWVWDIFDSGEQRALRISGQEAVKASRDQRADAWIVADDAMMQKIARDSMAQLAAFLARTEVALAPEPATLVGFQTAGLFGTADFTPESAGIYRIERPEAGNAAVLAHAAEDMPLPPKRPAADSGETQTLSALRRLGAR